MKIIQLLIIVSILFASSLINAAPVQWTVASGGNGHWYEFVENTNSLSIDEVEAAAESSNYMGLGGYLATITSSFEQAFLNTHWTGPGSVTGQFGGYSFYLIGHSDRDSEGSFTYMGGPEAGQSLSHNNWSSNEPNDNSGQGGGEDFTVAWWLDQASGAWNDVFADGSATAPAYLVEYSIQPSVSIPVSSSLLLLLAGLGSITIIRRSRS